MSGLEKQPDKAFFETNPRAALLRNICLEAIDASNLALEGGPDALAELMDVNTRLAELGVSPSMHTIPVDADPEERKRQRRKVISDPVIAAEWLSGQIRTLILETNGLATTTKGLPEKLQEHDEFGGEVEGAYMVGPPAADIARDLGMIGMLSLMVDYDAGPSDLSIEK